MTGSPAPLALSPDAVRATLVPCLSEQHRRWDGELAARGGCHPLSHRVVWLEAFSRPGGRFCAALDRSGACVAGFAVEELPVRALPGHRVLRVERYTPDGGAGVRRALLEALREHARRDRRVLSVHVELFCLDPAARQEAEQLLAELAFARSEPARRYEHTLVLGLGAEEPALLAGLHANARRKLRDVAKHPVEVRAVLEPIWADRLDALLEESLRRTGGQVGRHDWEARIAFSREHPRLSRIVGLFRTDREGPDALVAFAWGLSHGDYAHYDAAGATRSSGLRVSMGYPLMWDLICWARRGGARFFDFGGITFGHENDGEDALGGISDFKRYFCRQVVEVGGEWVFVPRPLKARVARAVGAAARRLRALRRG